DSAGSSGIRRGHQPHAERKTGGGCRVRRRGGTCRMDHTGAGRPRPDDDRRVAVEHGGRRAAEKESITGIGFVVEVNQTMSQQNLESVLKAAGNPVQMLRNSRIGAYVYPVV